MSTQFLRFCSAVAGVALLLVFSGSAQADFTDYFNAVMADGPEAYWSFEDGDTGDILNGTAAADNTGNHPGTYMGQGSDGPQLTAAHLGFGGNAAHFARTDSANGDFVLFDTLGDVGGNIDNNGVTFEFLFKNQQPDPSAANRLFGVWNSRPDGNAESQVSFGIQDLQERFGGPGDSFFLREEGGAAWSYIVKPRPQQNINDGDWHHVAMVVNPGVPADNATIIYVDGEPGRIIPAIDVFAPKALMDFANYDKEFIIGGDHIHNGTKRQFLIDAMVDEFAVYSKALSASEVKAHCLATNIVCVPEPASVVILTLGAITMLGMGGRKRW